MTDKNTESNEELALYNASKELSKKLLTKNLLEQLSAPSFDMINFAHLLAQSGGGEDGGNPLHGIFPSETIAHAKKFLAAISLLNQFYESLPKDDSIADSEEIETNSKFKIGANEDV